MNPHRTPIEKRRTMLVTGLYVAALIATLTKAHGEDPKPAEIKKWESVAAAGVTLTRGNSKTFLATAGINSTRKWEHDEALLGLSAGYGETTSNPGKANSVDTTTDNYIRGFAQWNHFFSENYTNWYAGVRFNGEHDEVANVDYRFTLSPLLGYFLIKQTNTFLALEIGPSGVTQRLGGEEKTYFAFRAAERGEYVFKNGSKIWESVEWIPQVDDFDNWIMNAEIGVSAPLSKALDLRLIAQDNYNNQPAPHRYKNDFKLIAAIGYKF
jgi:putative salt-induced outer membrane protein YdiY